MNWKEQMLGFCVHSWTESNHITFLSMQLPKFEHEVWKNLDRGDRLSVYLPLWRCQNDQQRHNQTRPIHSWSWTKIRGMAWTQHCASLSPCPGHDMIKHGFNIRIVSLKQNIPTLAVSGVGFMNGWLWMLQTIVNLGYCLLNWTALDIDLVQPK